MATLNPCDVCENYFLPNYGLSLNRLDLIIQKDKEVSKQVIKEVIEEVENRI